VDELLKTRFDLPRGLADTTRLPDGTHKVLVLDPAVGTATFLYAVIDLIREDFMARGDAGMWSDYVRDHLLERIFGFEIMMAPYAVAHFKLALQLAGHDLDLPEDQQKRWAYDFSAEDRIRVYLTNALEVLPEDLEGLYGPMQFVAEEARAANEVKQDKPIMVVLGNPPYSRFSVNTSEYIEELLSVYKEAVSDERNIQPLSDDYIKFLRFAHERIERTGQGIIGFITNHKYLHGLIHRGVREELLKTFDEIYILNLHGNTNIGEISPDGTNDKNVFDIKQGVAISLFTKTNNKLDHEFKINYSEMWGSQGDKYQRLMNCDLNNIDWEVIKPKAPNYFFIPKDFSWFEEYHKLIVVSQIFNIYSSGVKTHRDHFVIDNDPDDLLNRIEFLRTEKNTNETIRNTFNLNDTRDWNLEIAREKIQNDEHWKNHIRKYLYRPFDFRFIYYSSNVVELPRTNVMQNMKQKNIALIADRTTSPLIDFNHILVADVIVDVRAIPDYGGAPYIFPLYNYPVIDAGTLFDSTATSPWAPDPDHGNRVPNLDPGFVAEMEEKLGLSFDPHLSGRGHPIDSAFGPEDVLAYIYAVFHSPTYRERYAEFLKIDFPRVPLTDDAELFRTLVAKGHQLLSLHLMESPKLHELLTHYPIPGDDVVAPRGGYPKYTPPKGDAGGRVFINREQYFEGVPPAVWAFEIGGYQVLHKWLKDRRGRELSYDERDHYQQVVVALSETMRLMEEIDAAIPA
jgi:predicted helicase